MNVHEVKIEPKNIPFKCPVCNGFGTLKHGTITCHACNGKGYILVDNQERQTENEEKASSY